MPNGCKILISYCARTIISNGATIYQVNVDQVDVISGNCDAVDLEQAAIEGSFKNPANPNFGGCNQISPVWMEVFHPSCISKVSSTSQGGWGLRACGTGVSHCVEKCEVCSTGGTTIRTNCSYETIGTPSCTEHPPDNWTTDDTGCFLIDCAPPGGN